MEKIILIATFIKASKYDWFLEFLLQEHGIKKDTVFVFTNEVDNGLIVTFRVKLIDGKRIDINKTFPNSIPVHKKGNAIYTINALNKLIEQESGLTKGNIDYKSYKIDWEKYQGKIILNRGDELIINPIEKIHP